MYKTLSTLIVLATLTLAQDEQKPATEAATSVPPNPVVIMMTTMGEIELELFIDEAPKTVANFLGLAEGTKEFTDPKTAKKAKRAYYDGIDFHRVIANFMIQGGCPLGTGMGSPGFTFEDEINAKSLGLDKRMVVQKGQPHPYLAIRSNDEFQSKIVGPLARKLGITTEEQFAERQAEVQAAVDAMTLLDAYENQGYVYDDKLKSTPPNRGVLAMANSGPNTNGSQFFINLVDTPWLTGKHTVFGKVIKGMDIVDKIGAIQVDASSKPVAEMKIVSIRRKPAETAK